MYRLGLLLTYMLAASLSAQEAVPKLLPRLPVAPEQGSLDAAPAETTPVPERLYSFDPDKVEVSWHQRRWLLVHAGQVLKDFGNAEQDARAGLRLIQELRLSELGTIGTPNTVVEYWLTAGRAPAAMVVPGIRSVSIDPAKLRVEQIQGQWCLKDAVRTLFAFGESRTDAEQAMAVIRRHRFETIGIVGQVRPSMYVFYARPQDGVGAGLHMAGHGSSRTLHAAKFSRTVMNKDGTPRMEIHQAHVPSTGAIPEGVVQPVLPALQAVKATEQPSATRWHSQPHVGGKAKEETAERVTFDWRQVQLTQDEAGWTLKAGNATLLAFGDNMTDAQTALRVVRHYRLNEACFVGGDKPYLKYFTCPAASSQNVLLGVHGKSFNPSKVEKIRLENGEYVLADENGLVLRLADSEKDAAGLLQTIKSHRFNCVCRIGDPRGETMTLLVRTR